MTFSGKVKEVSMDKYQEKDKSQYFEKSYLSGKIEFLLDELNVLRYLVFEFILKLVYCLDSYSLQTVVPIHVCKCKSHVISIAILLLNLFHHSLWN